MYRFIKRLFAKSLHRITFFLRTRKDKRLPTSFKRVLVCNPAHIGDVILSTAVLPLLKEQFPGVEIGFLCGKWSKIVLESHPDVDHLHEFDHAFFDRSKISLWNKWRNHFITRKQAVKEIRALNYDLALDLYHYPYMTPATWSAKIKWRLGYLRRFAGVLLTHPLRWEIKDQSIVRYHLDLLEKIGIKKEKAFPTLPLLAKSPVEKDDFLLFHIGTGAPQREWPVHKWKQLAKMCHDEGHHLIFTGKGEREREQIKEITEGLVNVTNFCDGLDFSSWVALIAGAPLVVNVNTSAGHVASCFQTENVVLFCGIDKQEQWGPVNPHATLLMKKTPCYPCYKGCQAMSCIKDIEVQEVFEAIRRKVCVKG